MKQTLKITLLLLASSAVLMGAVALSEGMLLPRPLEGVGTLLGRMAHLILIPGRRLAMMLVPPSGFHWSLTHWALSCLITPPLIWLIWKGVHSMTRTRPRSEPERGSDTPSPSRRVFLQRVAVGSVGVVAAGMAGHAVLIAPQRLRIRRREIPISDLPPGLDGLRIAHLSDTHHGPYVARSYLERVIERVNALEPDLVVLTGDYVHRTPRSIAPGIGVFAKLRPRLGTAAVLGNHDHWEGAEACRAEFRKSGIPLIDNDRLFVTAAGLRDRPETGALCLAGVGDLWEDTVAPEHALRDVPEAMPRLLLSHNPDVAESLDASLRIDLMLSGHTHGGQVRVPFMGTPMIPSRFGQKYAGGLVEGPTCRVVISRGVGITVLPMRFGVPPEVGLITLRRG
jgi:uncharacterized protein